MTSHKDIAQAFAYGETKLKGSRMFIDNNAVYSFGYHFPIACRLESGTFLFNKDGYSQSTTRHKNMVRAALNGCTIIEVTRDKIIDAINAGVKTSAELMLKALEVTA